MERTIHIPLERFRQWHLLPGTIRIGKKRREGKFLLNTGLGFSVMSPYFYELLGGRVKRLETRAVQMPFGLRTKPICRPIFIMTDPIERHGPEMIVSPFIDHEFYLGVLGLDFLAGYDFQLNRNSLILKTRIIKTVEYRHV